jgi:PAS domain S-box-containing protein
MLLDEVRVLLVEDSDDDATLLIHELGKGIERPLVHRVETEKELRKALEDQPFDVVISDYILPRFSGLEALRIVRELNPYLPFLLVSGKIGEEMAVEAMRLGATDYIMKGRMTRLNQVIKRELEDAKLKVEGTRAKEDLRKSYEELKLNALRLEEANERSKAETEERRKAQAEAVEAKEFLSNIIDSASDLVISFDRTNRVATWNKVAQSLTGYQAKEILNRSIDKLNVFASPEDMSNLVKGVYTQGTTRNEEFTLRTKNNAKKIVRARGSVIRGADKKDLGVIFLGADITPEIEAHGRLMEGMSYLMRERNLAPPVDVLTSLVRSGYSGMLITRSNRDIIASLVSPSLGIKIMFLQNDEPGKGGMEEVVTSIRDFTSSNKKSVVLLDGVHYLVTKFGFDGFLQGLFEINDLAYLSRNILLVRLDPNLLDAQRMAMIENELYLLPSQRIEDIIIDDDVYGLLKYVFEENQNNSIVSIKKIMSKFQISFVTAAKRVEALEKDELLFVKKQGKLRTPYITEKGKNLLHKRRVS